MTTQTVTVLGMTCQHCVASVTEELGELAGVTRVQVDLHPGLPSPVTITSEHPLAPDALSAAIVEAGYRLQ